MKKIIKPRRKIESLNKNISRKKKTEKDEDNEQLTPNSKVHDLIKDKPIPIPSEVRKKLLFGEKIKSAKLKKNSKERQIFQRCVGGTDIRKYKLLHMAKASMLKQKNNKTIPMSDKNFAKLFPSQMYVERSRISFKRMMLVGCPQEKETS
nr:unnamed protein product [Callosobruchus analis]